MSVYAVKPHKFLDQLYQSSSANPDSGLYCAGFELEAWRCTPFAAHLVEWLPDYALAEEELSFHHGNAFVKLQQAAIRIYTSEKYNARGEAGEIALHAVCREFFQTIPISPRVFYKSTSNDVIKAFDMVHARFPEPGKFEIWLGESKLYTRGSEAIKAAITSINDHIGNGFLKSQKLLLGPQIPKTTPNYSEIIEVFRSQTSIDKFLDASVFVVGILSDSAAVKAATKQDAVYINSARAELEALAKRLETAGIQKKLRLSLIYIPVLDKDKLVEEFDKRLKGLQ